LSVVSYQLSVISWLLAVGSCQLAVVSCQGNKERHAERSRSISLASLNDIVPEKRITAAVEMLRQAQHDVLYYPDN
jgi:hypothetical protein